MTEEGNQYRPSVAVASDGSFGVAFQNTDLDELHFDTKMTLFDAEGQSIQEYALNIYTDDEQREPGLAAASDRGYVAVWESRGQDGDGDGIFSRRFLGPELTDDEEFMVPESGAGWQNFPAVAANDRFAVIVWQQTGSTGSFELGARVVALE